MIALVVDTRPGCAGRSAAICTPLGHLAAVWAGSAGATLGLAIVVVACWIHPRRQHGLWAFAGLAVAAAGMLVTFGLATGAPAV